MIYGLLPLLDGWAWRYKEYTGSISIGETVKLDEIQAPGYFVATSAHLEGSRDAKYVHIHVDIDHPERPFSIDFTPFGLYAFGSVLPIPFGGYVSKWDDANKTYTGSIVPARPVPFAHSFRIKLIAPSGPVEESEALDISYHAALVLIEIFNVERFKESVNRVFRGGLR